MNTSDADAVANLERVVLEALEIMDEKISKTLAGIERKIDDAVARSLEGRGAAAAKRFPKKRNANAAAETRIGAKRAASTTRATVMSSSESSSESKPNEDEAKDDSAKTRRANGGRANANGTTTSAKTVKTMKPAGGAKRKRQKKRDERRAERPRAISPKMKNYSSPPDAGAGARSSPPRSGTRTSPRTTTRPFSPSVEK